MRIGLSETEKTTKEKRYSKVQSKINLLQEVAEGKMQMSTQLNNTI